MCGIVGYIGKNKAKQVIIDGLKRLEYRGYDSSGIGVLFNKNIIVSKCKGKVLDLENLILDDKKIQNSNIGIGHTRWATHGIPNDKNAHPHQDFTKKFTIVHNGIIENYSSIKKLLLDNGITFQSDTDSEVLVQLIGYIYKKENVTFSQAVRLALKEVVGTYGLVVLCEDEPEKIIAANLGSALVLGLGDEEMIIASDSSPIIEYTRNIVFLDEGEMVQIYGNKYEVRNINENEIINKTINKIEYSLDQIEKSGFDHFMLKEIFEQPKTVKESLRGRVNFNKNDIKLGGINDWVNNIIQAKRIIITACGTSWHAALIGSFLIEELLNIPVKVEYASEFRYREVVVNSETLIIAISQSGETADTLAAIRKAKSLGALTLGIVNSVGSAIARETHAGVYIHAGPEIGVASTKAFTSQVTILNVITLFLAKYINNKNDEIDIIINELDLLSEKIQEILNNSELIYKIAEKYSNSDNFLYLGRGYQFPVALEGALKLKEISYIHAEGYPAAEMKHGPIALIDNNMPVVFLVTKTGFEKIISNIQEVKSRGGKIIIITSENLTQLSEFSEDIIKVPSIHKCLLPIVTTIPLQLLAYYIAKIKGCNIDQPRNLAKSVTVE